MSTELASRQPTRTRTPPRRPQRLGRPAILAVLAVVVLCGGHFASSGLPSWIASQAIVTQSLFLGVIAFGQGLVMLIGGIDLSIPGVVATSSTLLAIWTTADGRNVYLGVLVVLLVAAAIGLVDGFLVAYFQIPAFIVTLAMGTILSGLMTGITFGRSALAAPNVVSQTFSGAGKFFGIAIPVFVFALVAILGYLIQSKSRFGRQAYLLGSSRHAARLAGQPVLRVEICVYVTSAVASAVAGLMLLGFAGNAKLDLGNDWQMPAIAAVLVGGTVIGSGRGLWESTLAACLLLTTITVVVQATGVSEAWKSILYGAVVLAALLLGRGDRSLKARWARLRSRS
jgi:ribose transport system permease protein